ncbi:MAG: hypothetical protein BGO43_03005 [Gammaproteobacteria bacterium 39-13]|nr:hypothetical protein [Gammaproteobacteria bacterium]OJV85670.1 MAG: hypothetical protein BGO43_03005 [Gammaproteobacteria bacterium 39-13]
MLNKYPSLTSIYLRTFALYFKTFIDVLPFVLLLVIGRYGLETLLPQESMSEGHFFLRILIDSAITALFFSFIIYLIYQKNNAQSPDFTDTLIEGLRRFPQVLVAYLLISSPVFLALGLLKLTNVLWHPAAMTAKVIFLHKCISLTLMGMALLITLILATYSFVAGVFIVIKRENALSGLKKSWDLVQDYWIDTFLLMILFGMMTVIVSMLMETFYPEIVSPTLTMLFSSFYPALMVIHFNQMKRNLDERTDV